MRRWTRDNGHRLVKLFVEKAVPGSVAGNERPELASALTWIEERKALGIVAPNLELHDCPGPSDRADARRDTAAAAAPCGSGAWSRGTLRITASGGWIQPSLCAGRLPCGDSG